MRSKYLIWFLIPIVLIGGYILDINAKQDTMIPATYFTVMFSAFISVVGFIYFFLRKYMKDHIFILDIFTTYTFLLPILILFLALLDVLFNVKLNHFLNFNISHYFVYYGLHIYVIVQCLALILLLYVLAKKWKLRT